MLGLATRVPWGDIAATARADETKQLLTITLCAAAQACAIATVLGTGLALWLHDRGRSALVVRLVVYLPLAMPPVVGGLALTALLGRRGLMAPVLNAIGIQFAFSFPGVVVAQTFVALPFVIVAVDAALRQLDPEVLDSARGVGMAPHQVLIHVVGPMIAPAVFTGASLAFARCLGEFGTTLTFAGSSPGTTRTMPLGIYLEREVNPANAYALSALLVGLAVICLAAAALPRLLRRPHQPRPRELAAMDTAALRELCAPSTPHDAALVVTTAGRRTEFATHAITAVVGPNGAGKTTLAGIIAGRLRGGEVQLGNRTLDGVCYVPAHRRGIVLLTQRPSLPPTATAVRAVAHAAGNARRARQLLHAAGLGQLCDVPVPALSGGQAAQVGLIRALAARPAVLILDEPLSALDVASAGRWRALLQAAASDRTTLLITHDPLEVAALSTHVVALQGGHVVASGPTTRLLQVPPTDFIAQLAGVNRLTGTVAAASDEALVTLHCGAASITGVTSPGEKPHGAIAVFAPSAVSINLLGTDSSPRTGSGGELNHLTGTVVSMAATSLTQAIAHVATPAGVVAVALDDAPGALTSLTIGDAVELTIPPAAIAVFAATTSNVG